MNPNDVVELHSQKHGLFQVSSGLLETLTVNTLEIATADLLKTVNEITGSDYSDVSRIGLLIILTSFGYFTL